MKRKGVKLSEIHERYQEISQAGLNGRSCNGFLCASNGTDDAAKHHGGLRGFWRGRNRSGFHNAHRDYSSSRSAVWRIQGHFVAPRYSVTAAKVQRIVATFLCAALFLLSGTATAGEEEGTPPETPAPRSIGYIVFDQAMELLDSDFFKPVSGDEHAGNDTKNQAPWYMRGPHMFLVDIAKFVWGSAPDWVQEAVTNLVNMAVDKIVRFWNWWIGSIIDWWKAQLSRLVRVVEARVAAVFNPIINAMFDLLPDPTGQGYIVLYEAFGFVSRWFDFSALAQVVGVLISAHAFAWIVKVGVKTYMLILRLKQIVPLFG